MSDDRGVALIMGNDKIELRTHLVLQSGRYRFAGVHESPTGV